MKNTITDKMITEITENLIEIYASDKNFITKNECKQILNIVFELLFEEKLKNKNFDYIFGVLSSGKNATIIKKECLEPIVRSFIIGFNVNFITNTMNLKDDKICIKIGKHLLPIDYYLKEVGEE